MVDVSGVAFVVLSLRRTRESRASRTIDGSTSWRSWLRGGKTGESRHPRGAQHEGQTEAKQQVEDCNELSRLLEWSTDCVGGYSLYGTYISC